MPGRKCNDVGSVVVCRAQKHVAAMLFLITRHNYLVHPPEWGSSDGDFLLDMIDAQIGIAAIRCAELRLRRVALLVPPLWERFLNRIINDGMDSISGLPHHFSLSSLVFVASSDQQLHSFRRVLPIFEEKKKSEGGVLGKAIGRIRSLTPWAVEIPPEPQEWGGWCAMRSDGFYEALEELENDKVVMAASGGQNFVEMSFQGARCVVDLKTSTMHPVGGRDARPVVFLRSLDLLSCDPPS